MKVSIIIPVYNVEKYIEKTLSSVVKQTYKNIEIIVIDDGSTDNSLKICEKYQTNKNFKLIKQSNKGVSNARNNGLKIATGNYVLFIDGDDYIEKNMVEVLMTNILKNKSDICVCNYYIEEQSESKIAITKLSEFEDFDSKIFYKRIIKNDLFGGYLWNKLIKKTLINDVKFDENSKILEDMLFFTEMSAKLNKICYVNQPLYHYVQRENSVLHIKNEKRIKNELDSLEKILIKYSQIDIESYKCLKFKYVFALKKFLLLNNISKLEKTTYRSKLKKYMGLEIFKSKITIKEKLKLIILYIFPFYYKIYERKKNEKNIHFNN